VQLAAVDLLELALTHVSIARRRRPSARQVSVPDALESARLCRATADRTPPGRPARGGSVGAAIDAAGSEPAADRPGRRSRPPRPEPEVVERGERARRQVSVSARERRRHPQARRTAGRGVPAPR
jgi:hypothetical protein